MNQKYRNRKTAEAVARFWNKPLDKPDWYSIKAISDDETEIFVYDVIGFPFIEASQFIKELSNVSTSKLTVRINSPGGDIFDGMAIFNALKSHDSKIVTRVEGIAASMASVIALAGKEVQAYQNAMFMVHEPWTIMAGNQYDFRETADILEKISGNMIDIYAGNSNVGKREVSRMMKDETWLTAKEAKEKGFVDTILDGKAAKAQFDLSMFANAPEGMGFDTDQKPTARDAEKALREVGYTRDEAKAIIAGGVRALSMDQATRTAIESAKQVFNLIRR